MLRQFVLNRLQKMAGRREPDFIIGGKEKPYLLRWYVIPLNRWLNVYYHHFLRSDDDRALHDHPYCFVSWLLRGSYFEIQPDGLWVRNEGSIRFRRATARHRIMLQRKFWPYPNDNPEEAVQTLFITGPRVRDWGFWCPKGFVPWQKFTAPSDKGQVGAGCEEEV